MYTQEKRQRLNNQRAETLISELRDICLEGISKLEDAGYEPLVIEARRTQEYQNALYAQGRQPLEEVNRLRALADKDPITEKENKYKVTQTTHSKHIDGKAFDIICVNDGEPDFEDKNFISLSVVIYESLGLTSGSRWHFQDDAHFEIS